MSGPWEKYATQQEAAPGPWTKYQAPEASAQEGDDQSYLGGALDSFGQGFTFGFGDELTGHEAALLGRTPDGGWFDYSAPYQERYERAVAAERGQQDQFADDRPVSAFAGEVAGGIANPVARLGAL